MTYPAGLFFANQLQVNFLMPAQTAAGTATITITSGDRTVTTGSVAIAPVAPSIFTLNASNLAAAIPVLYHSDGSNTVEQIFALDSNNNVIAAPVDLGSATDQLYLSVYGTGIRGASSVTATVGDTQLQTAFAATSQYPGEDQVNVLLPQSLQGSGKVTLILTANGLPSNPVTFTIK
jgi:uncharacterized protein (TIGR03437 family)